MSAVTIVEWCQGVADEVKRLEAENERLRTALKQALRQWSMYADMVERDSDFNLEEEKSPEGDMYRQAAALCEPGRKAG